MKTTGTQSPFNIMTLPDERYRAVVQTRRFLLGLCNIQHTPMIFQERMGPLTKMILQHKQDVEEEQNDKTV